MNHKAGFVNIIGKPNVGKSTLMNALVGEKLSIITHKAQTTRRRIRGIVNTEDHQIVFSDTPGIIKPNYLLHEKMMEYVRAALEDADLFLFITEVNDEFKEGEEIIAQLNASQIPVFVIINKVDLSNQEKVEASIDFWKKRMNAKEVIPVSAKLNFNIDKMLERIVEYLPEAPPYFPKDELTDLPQRFFISEIIREKILINYKKEIPYSVEVQIETFKEEETIVRIGALIIVERDSQKGILIGHKGEAMKRVGTQARLEMEKFLQKKVFLELFVKVRDDWRNKEIHLKNFGY
jgi:GTPase